MRFNIINKSIKIIVGAGVFSQLGGCSFLHNVSKLLELKSNSDIQEQVLKEESETYKRLKEAIEKKYIREGMEAGDILRDIGKPVLVYQEDDGEKWVYKPATASWFTGEKIYLFFNKKSCLLRWEYVSSKN